MIDQKNTRRRFVLVSGYYGFDNLGDEAILEELINELKSLVAVENIVVLSNDPDRTRRSFGVQAISRWKPLSLISYLLSGRLFVSGGGGLFQDSTGIKSAIFYGCQISLARLLSVPTVIYAQGIGPFKTDLAKNITRLAMAQATDISVRDTTSLALLKGWNIGKAQLTADPVWNLKPTDLPKTVAEAITTLKSNSTSGASKKLCVGLSLRQSGNFSEDHFRLLSRSMAEALPESASVLLLPLQPHIDLPLLARFDEEWRRLGRTSHILDTKLMERPSQWLCLLSQCDLLVGMRLHALILALQTGVPVVGIAYDPKVVHVVNQFEQPILNLAKETDEFATALTWSTTIRSALDNRNDLSQIAKRHAESAKNMACQNFQQLARILDMQSDPAER